jgi:hypothetical protein
LHGSRLHPIGLVYSYLLSRYLSISVLPWGQESLDVLARQENPRVTRQETNRPHDPRSPRNPQYQNTHTQRHTNPERKSKSLQLLPAVSKHSWLLNTNFLLLLVEASSSSSWQRETEAFSFFLSFTTCSKRPTCFFVFLCKDELTLISLACWSWFHSSNPQSGLNPFPREIGLEDGFKERERERRLRTMHSRFFFLFFCCCLATTTWCNAMRAHVAPALKLLSLSPMHLLRFYRSAAQATAFTSPAVSTGGPVPGSGCVCGWVCAAVPHGKTGPSVRPSVRPPAS